MTPLKIYSRPSCFLPRRFPVGSGYSSVYSPVIVQMLTLQIYFLSQPRLNEFLSLALYSTSHYPTFKNVLNKYWVN